MKLSIFKLVREKVNWRMSQECDTNISIHIMSERPNNLNVPEKAVSSKIRWNVKISAHVVQKCWWECNCINTVTCVWTHEHVMISYKADISVCLLSPALHHRGDAGLNPAVYGAADPRLGFPWHVQLCSFIHKHSKMFLAWKLFRYTWYVCVGWQMHTLECVNGYLGTVALSFANFIWNVAWTQRSSQLQGLLWLWDSRSMKNMTLFLYWTLQRKLPQSEIWSWTLCHVGYFCFIIWQRGKKKSLVALLFC